MSLPASEAARVIQAGTELRLGDAEVVGRIGAGDRFAEEVLFRRYAPPISRMVLRLVGNRADAEDVLQETFVAVLRDLPKLRDPGALEPWIKRIAVRQAHRVFRKRRVLRMVGLDRGIDDASLAALADDRASPEVRAELALLDARLARLPPRLRIPWMLRYVDGASLPEIADVTGVSLATTKRRIAQAKKALVSEDDHD